MTWDQGAGVELFMISIIGEDGDSLVTISIN